MKIPAIDLITLIYNSVVCKEIRKAEKATQYFVRVNNVQDLFTGRIAVLATMHQKEQVIAPILQQELGLEVVVPAGFNTDQFGTFTRDRTRPDSQLATARLKALAALEITGASLAIASEGAFSPHPDLPMLPCDRELVLLLDQVNDLEIFGTALSTQTNFQSQTIHAVEEALEFARKVGFPDHGLVVMLTPEPQEQGEIIKGITDLQELTICVTQMLERSKLWSPQSKLWSPQLPKLPIVHLETDMRALYNPTRMRIIAQATQDLTNQAKSLCPACGAPGFTITARQPGLPCGWCHALTNLTLSVNYHCHKCGFTKSQMYPDGQKVADPGYCQWCNP